MLNAGDEFQHGRYRVSAPLGVGGMASVYEVFDHRLQTRWALKTSTVHSAGEQAQFEYEARLLARLDHPNLPRVIDFFAEGGRYFLVMELVPGDNLETMLARHGRPLDCGLVLGWAAQALDALEYLHAQQPPLIHRDIKPANLKISGTGRVKLLDFGIAKEQAPGTATVSAAKAFSLAYSPPEQFSVATHTDARSDIYALGATLYHLLTNHEPPSAPDRLRGGALAPPATLNPACPPGVSQAIMQAMALDPAQRFQTAGAFRTALARAYAGGAATVHGTPPTVPVGPEPWRPPRMLLGAGATLVVALLLYALGPWLLASSMTSGPTGQTPEPTRASVEAQAARITERPSETDTPPIAAAGVSTISSTSAPEAAQALAPTSAPLPTQTPYPTSTPAPSPTLASAPTVATWGSVEPQIPSGVTASDTAPPAFDSQGNRIVYDAANAVDGRPETCWRVPGAGIGQSLTLQFPTPIRITQVRILPGYARIDPYDGSDRWTQNRRIRRARLEWSDGTSVEATFTDRREMQRVSIKPVVSSSLRIVIEEATAPGRGVGRDFAPISEILVLGQQR